MFEGRSAPPRGRRGPARRLLPGTVLVVSVVLGLLAMHGFGVHHSAGHPPALSGTVTGADAATAEPPAAHPHHAVRTGPEFNLVAPQPQDGHQLGLAMTCLFLLLLAMVSLRPPRSVTVLGGRPSWDRSLPTPLAVRSRPPSLQLLCVSRT